MVFICGRRTRSKVLRFQRRNYAIGQLAEPLQINGRATPRNDRYRNGFGGRYKDLFGCRGTLTHVDAGRDRTFGADALEDELAGALA